MRIDASRVDLSLEGRSIMAVIGPNGAGKSTFMKGLCGPRPATGRVLLMMPTSADRTA
ncbi:ATP-binding cassette domain-containing protein [Agrobacterium sp. T29]|uniref:ATP-binding cassette domain-containing protein n=1 Tax=Agrobacterium sp. T29 TaxID=2580515 RepID=UPI00210F5E2A|nr:ATP-binding cassette domain-containing protein [Agrobacterium sp. T29]